MVHYLSGGRGGVPTMPRIWLTFPPISRLIALERAKNAGRRGRPIDALTTDCSPENLSDEQIVALCQRGDTKHFEVLVQRYMQKAFHIALNFTRNPEEAKDLSQDAFLRAFTRLNQFDGRSTFYTWFYRLVVNICLDHTRRKNRVGWESLEPSRDDMPERAELTDLSSSPEEAAMA